MGSVSVFTYVLFTGGLSGIFLCYLYPELYIDIEPPELPDQYFGHGPYWKNLKEFPRDKTEIKKYKIHVEDSVLEDLKVRLNNTRFVEPLDNIAFQYGFYGGCLKKIVDYWRTVYNWRKYEQALNKFSHFTTQIEGIDVHFIHQKPNVKVGQVRVLPLLLIHGWPGSIVEFVRIIPLLTRPRAGKDYVFEVISPSIPGYGFSEAPHQPGFDMSAAARVFIKLLDRLGIKQFYIQGGDWGGMIAQVVAKVYSKRVLGIHVNIVPVSLGPVGMFKYLVGQFFPSLFMSPEESSYVYPIIKWVRFWLEESGYLHIQATKPDTIGAALSDSPAGLAAYILEKFSTWTNRTYIHRLSGGLAEKFNLDDLLTNVMIYWATNSIASSTRFYKENIAELVSHTLLASVPVRVPTGIAIFPGELVAYPRSFLTWRLRNIVYYKRMPRGGHFAAMEEPDLLADEIWNFVVYAEKCGAKR